MRNRLSTISYRLGQVRQQLGFVAPLTAAEYEMVARFLPDSALMLFQTMSLADQRHSLRVCQGLQARGCDEAEMLAAALLHDVGKAQGRVPFWTRPVIVLGKLLFPRLLARVTVYPSKGRPLSRWRRALSYAWYHAEVGAELATQAGLSERAVLYIRTHHKSQGPARELHEVDEVS
jgi:putative nucleotidyltransferase with HDIG domain